MKGTQYEHGKRNPFTLLTIPKAPKASKPVLEKIKIANGFIPNPMAIVANNPAVLRGHVALDKHSGRRFSKIKDG